MRFTITTIFVLFLSSGLAHAQACQCSDRLINTKAAQAESLHGACTAAVNQAASLEKSYVAALKKAQKERNKKQRTKKVNAVNKQFASRRAAATQSRDQSCTSFNSLQAELDQLRQTCSVFDDSNINAVQEDPFVKRTILNQQFSQFGGSQSYQYMAEKMTSLRLSPSCNTYLSDSDSKRGAAALDEIVNAMDRLAVANGYTPQTIDKYEGLSGEGRLERFNNSAKPVIDSQLIPRFNFTLVANDFVCGALTSSTSSGLVYNYITLFFNLFQSPFTFVPNSGKINMTLVISPRVNAPTCKISEDGTKFMFAISSEREFFNPSSVSFFEEGILEGGRYSYQ